MLLPAAEASQGECSERLLFRVGSQVLALEVHDPAALKILEAAYGPLRCSSVRPPNCTASMRRLGDGRLHVRLGRRTLPIAGSTGDAPAVYLAAREIFARCAAMQGASLALYGVLLGTPRGGVLLLGPTAIGKTILALHMTLHGATFLGDETAIFSLGNGEISALPRRPSLRESALNYLPESTAGRVIGCDHYFETDRGRFWYGLNEDVLGVQPSSRVLPLRAVCILSGRGEQCAVNALAFPQALPLILQRAYARPSELAQIAAARHALRGVASFDVVLGKPEESASLLLQEIAACA